MFRNPRENAQRPTTEYLTPSVGRPPSPPSAFATPPRESPKTDGRAPRPAMATVEANSLPKIGRGSTNPRKTNAAAAKQPKGKPNASILTFFKKAEDVSENLFVQSRGNSSISASAQALKASVTSQDCTPPTSEEEQQEQYHESGAPIKRRKLDTKAPSEHSRPVAPRPVTAQRVSALFLEDSDSDEDDANVEVKHISTTSSPHPTHDDTEQISLDPLETSTDVEARTENTPALKHEETSFNEPVGDFADFEAMGDFDEDVFEDGDEAVERRWMEEQEKLEAEAMRGLEDDEVDEEVVIKQEVQASAGECAELDAAPSCPICSISLAGVADQDAAVHVNNCLDGKPSPLPSKAVDSPIKIERTESPKPVDRFRKVPRAPKPGQANPFTLGGEPGQEGGSAFSKLMSGKAEDAAWAEAAAAEKASYGKPAYQRTCPFYKILPGFNICVDAFRFGAVEGCKAYFLSHFHSDHYVGLTAQWCHGPIYCSKVTANLVKQQLRVDPQYVVALDWETKVEVPGTNGVFVTMISANHCPGSSLYLYEKAVGRGPKPKVHRILHCGDFRACRKHVEHPLLRPDVLDAATGKKRDQKIDVCYLDTTYLNSKYAFPSQEAVIKACADMCVSLSRVRADETDGWETMKRERAGAGMVKFIRKDSEDNAIKKEEEEEEEDVKPDLNAMSIMKRANAKHRGRLLVVVGTYSIGKERICMGIARALDSKIYAPPGKQRICRALEDPELNARLTTDPTEAQVHMTPLFEIRADTLDDYLKDYKDHFSRAVGFRPSGWNYRPPNSRFLESPSVNTVLHSANWKSDYSMKELVPQRGSTSRASCFGVPYSEHSSFRELTMFCCALNIDKIIPTVNVGNAKSRERMKGWCEKWAQEKRRYGLFKLSDDEPYTSARCDVPTTAKFSSEKWTFAEEQDDSLITYLLFKMHHIRRAALRALSAPPVAISTSARTAGPLAARIAAPRQSLRVCWPRSRCYSDAPTSAEQSKKEEVTIKEEPVSEAAQESTEKPVLETVKDKAEEVVDALTEVSKSFTGRSRSEETVEPNRTLYIGNLFFDLTPEQLKREFSKHGEVVNCKIVTDSSGMSRGFGYVEFDTIEAATTALNALGGTQLAGRKMFVQYHRRSQAPPRKRETNPPSETLFIGNMSFLMSDKDLHDLFKSINGLHEVRVAIDRRSGQPRGFAHVDFHTVEAATEAAKLLDGKVVFGRPLRIDFGKPSKARLQSRDAQAPHGNVEI